jgi:hypothetical protein
MEKSKLRDDLDRILREPIRGINYAVDRLEEYILANYELKGKKQEEPDFPEFNWTPNKGEPEFLEGRINWLDDELKKMDEKILSLSVNLANLNVNTNQRFIDMANDIADWKTVKDDNVRHVYNHHAIDCIICGGSGIQPNYGTTTSRNPCSNCGGTGKVWV